MMNTHYEVLGWNEQSVLTCHAKIGPAGPILAKKPAKSGPPDHFAAKIGLAGPILAAKLVPLTNFGPPGGPILAKSYLPKSVPPVYYFLCYTIELSH